MVKKIPVLVIEQDNDLRESLSADLGSDGFEVHAVADGPSGIEAASKYKPHLILLDVTDGLENIASELKLNSRTSTIPVIILTDGNSVEAQQRASRLGADNYITKPFADDSLAEIVKLKLENCEAIVEQRQQETKRGRGIPVLVIDDEDDIRRVIELSLRIDGFEVYTAVDGPAGIKAARKYKPHLILLDVMMPGMDGLEVLLNLKWNKKTKDIPVFMLTAKSTMGDMDKAFARRADDYLTKPFDGEKLGKTIKEKLEKLKV